MYTYIYICKLSFLSVLQQCWELKEVKVEVEEEVEYKRVWARSFYSETLIVKGQSTLFFYKAHFLTFLKSVVDFF